MRHGYSLMDRPVTDEVIVEFLRRNQSTYRSPIDAIQSTVEMLWPEGLSEEDAERVIRLCFLRLRHVGDPEVAEPPPSGDLDGP